MGRNAMNEQDKEARRRALLEAARRLFRDRIDLPPVSEIATSSGLAKGTVYLYFKTKEEIFIALLEDDFAKLFDELHSIINELPENGVEASALFARRYFSTILDLQDFLPLASLANGVLEQNLPTDVMRGFKEKLAIGLVNAGRMVEARFGKLVKGQGATLLLQTYALTLGLWQALDYPVALRELLNEEALQPLNRHFATELAAGIGSLWLGCLMATNTNTESKPEPQVMLRGRP